MKFRQNINEKSSIIDEISSKNNEFHRSLMEFINSMNFIKDDEFI